MTQEKIETIMVNNVEYVRADSVQQAAQHEVDGMRYAIIRSIGQGVMCGYVESINGRAVRLLRARQIWAYDSTFVLPDLADHGPRCADKMKMSVAMTEPCIMLEACGVLYCSDMAGAALRGIPAQKK